VSLDDVNLRIGITEQGDIAEFPEDMGNLRLWNSFDEQKSVDFLLRINFLMSKPKRHGEKSQAV